MNKKLIISLAIFIFLAVLILPNRIYADNATSGATKLTGDSTGTSSSSTSIEFKNPLTYSSISQVLTSLLSNLKSVVIVIAIIFIVLGGLMYMLSGGNEKTITRAKACIGGAIIGLAIVMAAPIFLNEIIAIFGGSSEFSTGSSTRLKTVAENVLTALLSGLGIIAIITLVFGGQQYLTSFGDEKKIESAKKIVTYAIIGIIIALAALVIVRQVGALLEVTVS